MHRNWKFQVHCVEDEPWPNLWRNEKLRFSYSIHLIIANTLWVWILTNSTTRGRLAGAWHQSPIDQYCLSISSSLVIAATAHSWIARSEWMKMCIRFGQRYCYTNRMVRVTDDLTYSVRVCVCVSRRLLTANTVLLFSWKGTKTQRNKL